MLTHMIVSMINIITTYSSTFIDITSSVVDGG